MKSFLKGEKFRKPFAVYDVSLIVDEVFFHHHGRRKPLFEQLRRDFDKIGLGIESGVFRELGIFGEKMDDVPEFVKNRRR